MTDITLANDYFLSILEGKEWISFEEEDRRRALGSAMRQVRSFPFRDRTILDGTLPDDVQEAVYLQALYSLMDDDKYVADINQRNGYVASKTKLDKVETSSSQGQTKALYPEVERMLKHYRRMTLDWL